MMNDMDLLPRGWTTTIIENLVGNKGIFIDGDWVESKDQDVNGDVRLIQLADIGDGVFKDKSDRHLTYGKAVELGCTFIQKGDVLIARMPDPLGRACIFPGDPKKSVTVVDVCIVRVDSQKADNRWLMHCINSPQFRDMAEYYQSGSTRKRISRSNLAKIEFPLPPLDEQERIVERIESLFSQLDAGVAALKRAQANLKRYKAAVLKAACEGRLVPQDPNDEPAEEMLKRIHPGGADLTPNDLPELPQGWCWARMEHLGNHRLGKMLDKEKNIGTPRPYLRNANVRWFNFDLSDLLQIKVTDEELKGVSIQPGDLVVCEGGEPGRSAVWDKEEPIVFQKALHRLRPHTGILAKYLNLHLAADASRGRLEKHFTGSTIKHFTGEAFRSYITAIPPTPEQVRIVNEMDRQFSIIQEMENAISANLSRAVRLRQSILKLAFEGRLVEQAGEVEEEIAQISSATGWKQEKLEIE